MTGPLVESLPTLPVHALSPAHSTAPASPRESIEEENGTKLSRSASYTNSPNPVVNPALDGLKRTFSENVLALSSVDDFKPSEALHAANKELFHKASKTTKNRISSAKFTLSAEDLKSDILFSQVRKTGADDIESQRTLTRSVTGTLRSFARKSWIPSTATPPQSPPKDPSKSAPRKGSRSPTKKQQATASNIITLPEPASSRSASRSPAREDESYSEHVGNKKETPPVGKYSLRRMSSFGMKNKSETNLALSRSPSSTSIRSRASLERLQGKISSLRVPPLPASLSSDKLSTANVDANKRKDPLWSAFRSLEGEYVNFQSKSLPQKAKVLRSSLLEFLRKYSDHPSNSTLRAEDLDRRVVILSRWWTGLLEMLNGRNNQAISPNDRPTFLDAIGGIMTRPEWRIPPFPPTASLDTSHRPSLPKSKSTQSIELAESEFLIDSVYQNVRNTFVQNLLSQMVFVVDRMSMRSAPASLVAFCGRACAYAFFFCPGVADILVRLWRIPAPTLRKVVAEFNIDPKFDFRSVSGTVSSSFPPPIRSLCLNSTATLARHLQSRTPFPTGSPHINWLGPWIGRWSGRDSDLLFVFIKHFHLLVSEHLSLDTPKQSWVAIPGLVPVHAQILTVLEITLYRQAGQIHADNYASGKVENLELPDAPIPLPITLANAARSMAENRLIILLRDLLADNDPNHQLLRDLYVSSFDNVVKAATRKISLYNNDACFVLCDLMDEVLPIMSRFDRSQFDTPVLDWPFWLKVCRQMMQSHNSMTEVRLLAFVYSTWPVLVSDEGRRKEVVLDWILEPAFFEKHFNHWCPMVRAYFHRLLCWRVARSEEDASELDLQIFQTLEARLNDSWAHYQYLKADADMRDTAPPSSAACTPAPSRRLIILRTDTQPPPSSVFATFEKLISTASLGQASSYVSPSSILNTLPGGDSPGSGKKRWSLFRNIIPFNSPPGNNRPGEVTPPSSPEETPFSATLDTASLNGILNQENLVAQSPPSGPKTPSYQAFSFKFSLEWVDRPIYPSRDRILTAPQLPAAAHTLLHSETDKLSDVKPKKPASQDFASTKYAGRSLAEWAMVVQECRSFFVRRKDEGVPNDSLVETPSLGSESFRMAG